MCADGGYRYTKYCYNDFNSVARICVHVIKQNPKGETEEKGRDSYEKMDENDSHNDGCSDGIDSLRRQ